LLGSDIESRDNRKWIMAQNSCGDDARETLRRTFDRFATLYDRARPNYPEQLFDDLLALGNIEPGTRVLEIGCGTGKASLPLARRGCRLVCVELGERLAEIARLNLADFPLVDVITTSFDTWELQVVDFDMVFAASAWHWLDPSTRYGNAARLLKPGGLLALVTGGHAFPKGFDSFFTEIQSCYDAIGESLGKWPPPSLDEIPDERKAIEGSGLFEDVQVRRYLWAIDYTADGYLDLLNTYSDHIAMNKSKRDILYAEIRQRISGRPSGRIRKHYLSILNIARGPHVREVVPKRLL
jgi:SAM-dependent methyltransferase